MHTGMLLLQTLDHAHRNVTLRSLDHALWIVTLRFTLFEIMHTGIGTLKVGCLLFSLCTPKFHPWIHTPLEHVQRTFTLVFTLLKINQTDILHLGSLYSKSCTPKSYPRIHTHRHHAHSKCCSIVF